MVDLGGENESEIQKKTPEEKRKHGVHPLGQGGSI